MLPKNFDPAEAEPRIYEAWEAAGAFKPFGDGVPFTIVIPPPNVTGSLHMGHALNDTLQDILCRFHRMRGRRVLWQPGMDHAGIATQMVVERQLAASDANEDRRSLGRDAFIERVWEWKAESGGVILRQLRRLGASCDWSRERFTMDEGLSAAVLKVFVTLYREGLIYRDKRLVNWDPRFETAISDLEVENKEVNGQFWHFKYPLEKDETYEFPVAFDDDGNPIEWETRDYISIATTRPETMLGDGAVAVHPDDKRYASIVGKRCHIPVGNEEDGKGRLIPIITDEYPDPDFGSGAVKITGAHDFNDYQVAKRNDIPMYVLMDGKARMLDADYVPPAYRGLDRYDARQKIVEAIDGNGLMIAVEDKKIMQPFGDRSGVVIEPMLTDQWYVDAKALAVEAIAAVEDGRTRFIPENWSKTYFQWMRNIEPWCVSRQLWWGHRIPAWYGTDGSVFVAESEEEAAHQAIAKYVEEGYPAELIEAMVRGESDTPLLVRDEDVLDTWFSSALWPFSTLGWPDAIEKAHTDHKTLLTHYPTSVLVTAFDIIFFWVARMMMMGCHFMKDAKGQYLAPFPDVYIHGLVVDEKGQKMSKSKGNGVDPLDLIEAYGADALRFSLAAQAGQGRNVRISESRVEGYRNFSTKLWNAARFVELNGCGQNAGFDPTTVQTTLGKWIIHETRICAKSVTAAIEAYRFNDAATAIYRFTWNVFCDWHLEFAKPKLSGPDGLEKSEVQFATAWVLDQILKMLHPFMPFVTEEIWAASAVRTSHLIVSEWVELDDCNTSIEAADEINWLIGLISEIRSVRQTADLPAGQKFRLYCIDLEPSELERIREYDGLITRLARLEAIEPITRQLVPSGVALIWSGATYLLDVAETVDLGAVLARLKKEALQAEKEIAIIEKKLGNQNFIEKAPVEVVDEQRERHENYVATREKVLAALSMLKEER